MATLGIESIRTLALIGAPASGKSWLAEALFARAGEPVTGALCDHDPEEKNAGHSLKTTVLHGDMDGVHLQVLDTPGYPDFIGHTLAALSAVDTAVLVVDAQRGPDQITRRLAEHARAAGCCRMIVVNRIDAAGADPQGVLAALREAFGRECLPLNLPARGGTTVADCFFEPGGEPDFGSVEESHTAIVEQVVELDEDLTERYLEQGQNLTADQLHDAFEQALREGHLIPVCFTSARTGAGVAALRLALERLAPHPAEGIPPHFQERRDDGRDVDFEVVPDPARHVVARVFKVVVDPFIGRLALFRVYQGTVTPDTPLFINDARRSFKPAHLYKLHGRERREVPRALPGDICAVAKVDELGFDDVLHDSPDEAHVHLAPLAFPDPLHGAAIEASSRNDDQKLGRALATLAAEDPSLRVERVGSTNETVIRTLGDLHLRITLERLRDRFGLGFETRPPRIPYRETIRIAAEGHYRHKKQTGGAGQFGEVELRIEPLERGAGFQFVNAVSGGHIPGTLIPAVEKGVRQVLESGALAGYPLQDVKVTVLDGKHHPVDSKEVAFVIAGRKAFLDALGKAQPVLLEPVVSVEFLVPPQSTGAVTGDLAGMRARILGTETLADGYVRLNADVPWAEIAEYGPRLKSATGGDGSYSLQLAGYEPVPPPIQQRVVAAYKPHPDED